MLLLCLAIALHDVDGPIRCRSVERVTAGWQTLLHRLFGIRLVERDDVALYHPDARYFDVVDDSGEVFSGLYLDLPARPLP